MRVMTDYMTHRAITEIIGVAVKRPRGCIRKSRSSGIVGSTC